MLMAASVTMSGSVVARHVHDEAMADPARGAQAALATHHRGHQFVRVEAPLHQRFGLAALHPCNRLGRGRMAVRRIDDDKAREILAERRRGGRDLGLRPDQDGFEEPQRHRLEHRAEGRRVAGMRHRDLRFREVAGDLEKAVILLVPLRRRRRLACESCHHIDLRSMGDLNGRRNIDLVAL